MFELVLLHHFWRGLCVCYRPTAGVGSRPDPLSCCTPPSTDIISLTQRVTYGLCPHMYADELRRYTNLRFLSAVFVTGITEQHHQLCRRRRQLDVIKSTPAEYCKDQDSVVWYRSTFASAATVATSSWQLRSYASHWRPRARYLYRCWRFNEVTCDKDRFWLFRCIATAAESPPVYVHFVGYRCSIHYQYRSFCHGWTTATPHFPESRSICWGGFRLWWTRLADWCFLHRGTTTSQEHRKVTGRRPPGLYIQILTVDVA